MVYTCDSISPSLLSQQLPEGKQLSLGYFIPHLIHLQIVSPEYENSHKSLENELARASKSTFTSAF